MAHRADGTAIGTQAANVVEAAPAEAYGRQALVFWEVANEAVVSPADDGSI